jgi:hypothetical protein
MGKLCRSLTYVVDAHNETGYPQVFPTPRGLTDLVISTWLSHILSGEWYRGRGHLGEIEWTARVVRETINRMNAFMVAVALAATPVMTSPPTIEGMIQAEFGVHAPIMIEIARCESGFRHFNEDGRIIQGEVDHLDTGIFQISKKYWLDDSIKLGYNIATLAGNIKMAKHIYDRYGTEPWNASRSCWMRALPRPEEKEKSKVLLAPMLFDLQDRREAFMGQKNIQSP